MRTSTHLRQRIAKGTHPRGTPLSVEELAGLEEELRAHACRLRDASRAEVVKSVLEELEVLRTVLAHLVENGVKLTDRLSSLVELGGPGHDSKPVLLDQARASVYPLDDTMSIADTWNRAIAASAVPERFAFSTSDETLLESEVSTLIARISKRPSAKGAVAEFDALYRLQGVLVTLWAQFDVPPPVPLQNFVHAFERADDLVVRESLFRQVLQGETFVGG